MKIALIGATGYVGSTLLQEALNRGHEVTALARHPEKLTPHPRLSMIKVDVLADNNISELLTDHDVVISAFNAFNSGLDNAHADERDLDWTLLSPSALLQPGIRTGQFRLGRDQLITDNSGNSHISVEDYAVAMIDEMEVPKHSRMRFTAGY